VRCVATKAGDASFRKEWIKLGEVWRIEKVAFNFMSREGTCDMIWACRAQCTFLRNASGVAPSEYVSGCGVYGK
jgi:hypothetical protein